MSENAAAFIAAGAGAVLMAGALLFRASLRRRLSPIELERRRRAVLNQTGKMGDGMVIDTPGDMIEYSYEVRGAQYTATQDISSLQDRLHPDGAPVAGPAVIKYDPRNPANSIVVCEDWSGLRHTPARQATGVPEEME